MDTAKRSSCKRKLSVLSAVLALPSSESVTISDNLQNVPARTTSFGAVWAGSFPSLQTQNIKVHTLILGTHPSITSLKERQYFGHPMNSFWWIAGDCLGFRRGEGLSKQGKPYKFSSELRYDNILPYTEQIELFCSKGFALWDVVGSCERKGSLDQDIKNEVPNDIIGFCKLHPNIQRIVFANGGTGVSLFLKHFKQWWLEGSLKPGNNDESQRAFGRIARQVKESKTPFITCISAISVSPAAAIYDYPTKRKFWEEHVYRPGLELHLELQR